MNLELQIIEKKGKEEFVVLPYNDYLKIQNTLEDLIDLRRLKSQTVNECFVTFYRAKEKIVGN